MTWCALQSRGPEWNTTLDFSYTRLRPDYSRVAPVRLRDALGLCPPALHGRIGPPAAGCPPGPGSAGLERCPADPGAGRGRAGRCELGRLRHRAAGVLR